MNNIKYIFYGTGPLAEAAIYTLYHSGMIPMAIVTKPDSKVGRDHTLTAPMIKTWALSKGIRVFQPTSLKLDTSDKVSISAEDKDETKRLYNFIKEKDIDIAIVASYGKIMPEAILHMPKHGTINIHPSMLPLYRGPSPIESQLLDGLDHIGLSIMELDRDMDHGPIYVQTILPLISDKEYSSEILERMSGRAGAELISQIIMHIIDGVLRPIDQDHNKASYCKYVSKDQGELLTLTKLLKNINIKDSSKEYKTELNTINIQDKEIIIDNDIAKELSLKWRALRPWPGVFFFYYHKDRDTRVTINKINWQELMIGIMHNDMSISKIIIELTPEGKRSMDWDSFKRGYIH